MSINFCTYKFQPILECSQMQLDGYEAQNLAKDFSQNNGFLADPLQRPPVDIYIRLPFNIDIKFIYFGPNIGHHRSTLIEISVNHQIANEQTSWLINPSLRSNKVDYKLITFHRIVQILNDDESIQRIEIYNADNTQQTNANTKQYTFYSNNHLINCSVIKLSIKRTYRSSSCALKYLQIWGTISSTNLSEIQTKIQQIFSPPSTVNDNSKPSESAESSKDEIPSEFLDSLTNDLMLIPMLLPSGHLIDRTTLERCTSEDIRWCRLPRDPFTLEPFTDTTQPVVAQQLKVRIDQFLSEHQNDEKYRHYGRLLDANKIIPDRHLLSFKRKRQ